MKMKVTKKEMRENYKILKIANCHTLLSREDPIYYSVRVEGWACDYYIFDDVVICMGYDPIGEKIPDKIADKFNKKARLFLEKTRYTKSYNYQKTILKKWIYKMIEEIGDEKKQA